MKLEADLVLEGGGVKGIALAGAFWALKEAGYEFHRVAGSSAGSIVGAMIAADLPREQLKDLVRGLDFSSFRDRSFRDRLWPVGKGLSILFEKGIYEGNHVRDMVHGILSDAGKATFGDLKLNDPGSSLPPERQYRLVVMVSDVSRGELVKLPWDYARYGLEPDRQIVADAIRASISIPFFFEPFRLQGRDDLGRATEWYMVDGGMLSNFPVGVFDRTDDRPPRWPTFGIKLSAKPESAQRRFEIHGTVDFAKALLGTTIGWYDQMHIEERRVADRTIFVDTTGVRATDFDLDRETQDRLFENGRVAAARFLETWDFDRYLEKWAVSPE